MTADDIIALLDLTPHPEGGYYRQTWIEDPAQGRPAGTCIYFLLKGGERSAWHRVDATEIWHHYAGAPVALMTCETNTSQLEKTILGAELTNGQRPQAIVPKHWWQAAECIGDWSLVGCTVSPGFHFDGFEIAAPDMPFPSEPI